MRFKGQKSYAHEGELAPQGILLTNLGTPDDTEIRSVRRYLKEFLSDPRVVEIPRAAWWLILHLFILPLRPKRSARLYKQVWTEDGSPLLAITQKQASKLQHLLNQRFGPDKFIVKVGMRYGNPSLASALKQLTEANVRNIIVLPLYPQYCAVTTGSTFDGLSKELSQYRWVPELKFISGYHQNSLYIQSLANSIQDHISQHGMPDRLLFSYHGTPIKYLHQGDPYFCFCTQTTRLVAELTGLNPDLIMTTFQSRFGKASWLQPYTDKTLQSLASENISHVAIICPGFAADCLETVEEIDTENRETFLKAGGKHYHYIPCLNDSTDHIAMMMDLVAPNTDAQALPILEAS